MEVIHINIYDAIIYVIMFCFLIDYHKLFVLILIYCESELPMTKMLSQILDSY